MNTCFVGLDDIAATGAEIRSAGLVGDSSVGARRRELRARRTQMTPIHHSWSTRSVPQLS
jgi:hypothetical protein